MDLEDSVGRIMQAVDYLAAVFPGLGASEPFLAPRLAAITRVLNVATNSILCRQGTEAGVLQWLLEGQVALWQAGPNMNPAVIDVVQPITGITVAGGILGQAYAITAQAVAPSRVLEIQAAPFRQMTASRPALALELMRSISRDSVSAIWQIVDLKTRKTAERLGHYLLSLVADPDAVSAEYRLPFQKGMLAGKLGCRQENLSRAFSTLREFGVETHGSRVILTNIPALRAFSGAVQPADSASVAEAFSRAFEL